ncbi:MAG: SulP family inorganic anion transporter [Burkholderiales bacterium]|nr:SulP family inorganic anion transporter [Burkholderiales bacterium]
MSRTALARGFPFLRWLPYTGEKLRADLVAGVTVALVLVPQSMAYAQLAGVPAYHGLYAALVPVVVAAMWGSSNQLASGPVAVVSLLTASALTGFAAPGSETFVALAASLALLVGLIQLALGAFRLGLLVNFLSHPVVVGFTSAAALIIGLSQLNKLLGVPMDRTDSFARDVLGVLAQVGDTHLPTLAMGLAAIALIFALRRWAPRLPGVLIAVAVTTAASAWLGYEKSGSARIDDLADPEARRTAADLVRTDAAIAERQAELAAVNAERTAARRARGPLDPEVATLGYRAELLRIQVEDLQRENRERNRLLRRLVFERVPAAEGGTATLYFAGQLPSGAESDGVRWRIARVQPDGRLRLSGGGEVVGAIPAGLPPLALPTFSWDLALSLLGAALVIAMVGFMEAISIAKAMAARSRQRIDPNQELLGQGLANVAAALSQAFPVSGSFSRTAVNANAGAVTGMSSVFAAAVVLVTLLLLTPLLHHLPQAVLAAVIMVAVAGLPDFAAMRHAWQANRHDGVAAAATFVATLVLAPHLDGGILVGVGLAIALFLLRTMKPRVVVLALRPDGALAELAPDQTRPGASVTAVRFDGRLYFANVSFFEDAVLEAIARDPATRHLLVIGDGINELDASGDETLRRLVSRLREAGIGIAFCGLKEQVLAVMRATGLLGLVGEGHIYPTAEAALRALPAPAAAARRI